MISLYGNGEIRTRVVSPKFNLCFSINLLILGVSQYKMAFDKKLNYFFIISNFLLKLLPRTLLPIKIFLNWLKII